MNVDRAVLAFAAVMILVSLPLAWYVGPYWLLLTAFVGLNMLQAAFTGFCPAAMGSASSGSRPAVRSSEVGQRGSVIDARRPPVARLARRSSPPWACTIERAIARPSPTPPVSRLRDSSRR